MGYRMLSVLNLMSMCTSVSYCHQCLVHPLTHSTAEVIVTCAQQQECT